jgi:hypothetical protein
MHVDYSRLTNKVAIKLGMNSSYSANNKGLHDNSDLVVNPGASGGRVTIPTTAVSLP